MEVALYSGDIASVLWGDSFSTVEVVQYSRGNISTCRGITSVLWRDTFSTMGDNSSTCGLDSFSTVGISSVLWRLSSTARDNISTVGDSFSTMEGIQWGNNGSTYGG